VNIDRIFRAVMVKIRRQHWRRPESLRVVGGSGRREKRYIVNTGIQSFKKETKTAPTKEEKKRARRSILR